MVWGCCDNPYPTRSTVAGLLEDWRSRVVRHDSGEPTWAVWRRLSSCPSSLRRPSRQGGRDVVCTGPVHLLCRQEAQHPDHSRRHRHPSPGPYQPRGRSEPPARPLPLPRTYPPRSGHRSDAHPKPPGAAATVWYSKPERRLSSSSTAICSCQPSACPGRRETSFCRGSRSGRRRRWEEAARSRAGGLDESLGGGGGRREFVILCL